MSELLIEKDYSGPAPAVITDLINQANQKNFVASDFDFGTPAKFESTGNDTEDHNTMLDVTHVATDVTTRVYYKRIDLGARKGLRGGLTLPYTNQAAVVNLLDEINAAAGLNLTTDDVLNTSIDVASTDDLPYSLTLKAREGSLMVIGQAQVTLVDPNL